LQRVEEGPGDPKTVRLPAALKIRESSGAAIAIAGKRKPG
jgi:hypothetical protein